MAWTLAPSLAWGVTSARWPNLSTAEGRASSKGNDDTGAFQALTQGRSVPRPGRCFPPTATPSQSSRFSSAGGGGKAPAGRRRAGPQGQRVGERGPRWGWGGSGSPPTPSAGPDPAPSLRRPPPRPPPRPGCSAPSSQPRYPHSPRGRTTALPAPTLSERLGKVTECARAARGLPGKRKERRRPKARELPRPRLRTTAPPAAAPMPPA